MTDDDACSCLTGTALFPQLRIAAELGTGPGDAEVTLLRCHACHRAWLKVLHEEEGFSRSGRWWMAIVEEAEIPVLAATTALARIGAAPWHLRGGSYFGGRVTRGTDPPRLG